nr:nicotinate-nucleotide--dimethylbenzimidazole phosphoribosyltransferase [[Eubacterium] cellulosolvens]
MIRMVTPPDFTFAKKAQDRWNSIAHPLHSLGKLEDLVIRAAGIQGSDHVHFERKCLIVLCADNGVVEEGVTQTGQEVTAAVAENFLSCRTSAAILCKKAGADILPVDIGVARDTALRKMKIAYGTKNMAKEPAMTRDEAVRSILTGIRLAGEKKAEGYHVLATGEMGIGNTTTSSAVSSVLLGKDPEVMTGKGAGLTSEGLIRKTSVIRASIALHRPDPEDPIDVLSKVGGFDIGGMAGVFIGGALHHMPVVIDGFISGTAALLAARLCPEARNYMIASHVSKEPAARMILEALDLSAHLTCDMCLGEGSGAVVLFPVMDMALEVYRRMSTFEEEDITAYEELK